MKLSAAVAGLSGLACAFGLSPSNDRHRTPTRYESAVMGRRILALTKLGTLSTVFPSSPSDADADTDPKVQENRPEGLGGIPFGLMDYIADCEEEGNPTLLALNIETSFKNVRDGSNITLSLRWTPPYPPAKRISLASRLSKYLRRRADSPSSSPESAPPDTVPYSAANLPRLSLVGYLEPVAPRLADKTRLADCYLAKHRDARYWLPGNPIHTSRWTRLVVSHVYWLGGFGDRAYIGWIPVEEWNKVTKQEWQSIRLPGEEKDWSEWSLGEAGEL